MLRCKTKFTIVLRAVCVVLICGLLLSGISVSSYAIIDATNKSTLAPHLATQSQGDTFLRNKWIVAETGKLIYPILKLTQEGKLHNPTAILISHIKKNADIAELGGFDVDGIEEVREGQVITGFSLPVTRNGTPAYRLVYNLQGGDTAIQMKDGVNVYVILEPIKEVDVKCNLCGANSTELVYTVSQKDFEYKFVRCKRCGLVYVNPQPSQEYLSDVYSEKESMLFLVESLGFSKIFAL